MDTSYEIFRDDAAGAIWVENVKDPGKITERLKHLRKTKPGKYFAYDVSAATIVARLAAKEPEMIRAYDLVRRDQSGKRIWIETVIGLQNLEKRLLKLSSIAPGTYLVYDPTEAQFVQPFKKSA